MFHDTVGGFIIIQHTGVDKMIHCDECKYFRAMTINPYMPRHSDTCLYPKNLGTWKSADEPKRGPSYINKNCDCPWFEKSETLLKKDNEVIK